MLFIQGSRDAFGTKQEIETIIKTMKLRAELYSIDGGDHSFKVPKSVGLPEQIYTEVMGTIANWISRTIIR